MNTTHAHAPIERAAMPAARAPHTPPVDLDAATPARRATAAGHFSIVDFASFALDAEPGLVIRVHAGCLWVPHHDDHCSIGIGPGEHFVAPDAGVLTVLATARAHVELQWPARIDATASTVSG